ncbi:MAG: family 31 glucosidase, partial [Bifidobacteriales bacterium]|nr:family 31 glucosidase [Bifidobacteriales bacterium]
MYEDFQIGQDYLVWTGDGETIRIEAWGRNSVRVRATRNDAFNPHDWALLPKDKVVEANQRTIDYQHKIEKTSDESCSISLDQNKGEATLTNGSIIVKARSSHHHVGSVGYEVFRCELSFWDDKGRCLLREAPAGGSLMLKARQYEPIAGGSYGLKVSFISSQDEHLYGMGEYQQNILDIKGCTFELAHRNSQASVPFV